MEKLITIIILLFLVGCSKNDSSTGPNGTVTKQSVTIVSGFSGKDTVIIDSHAQKPTVIGTYDLSSFDSLKMAFAETAMAQANQLYTINFEIGSSCLRQDTLSPPASRNYSSIIRSFEIVSSSNVTIDCYSWGGSIKLYNFSIVGWKK
jgi:hypothetical protein